MVGMVVLVLFAVLAARLWYLQVMTSPGLSQQAAAGQRRTFVEPAPRGRILDRNGTVVVGNRLSRDVTVDRLALSTVADPNRRAGIVERLAAKLTEIDPAQPRSPADLLARLDDRRFDPLLPVPVASDVAPEVGIWFAEHRGDFDGVVDTTVTTKRTYPYGQTAVHLLGYVGAINETEMEARKGSGKGYLLSD
jgi:penicillin-binding protein 2